jgi:large subunit ribosomal protein L6
MSRIGKMPLTIPFSVDVTLNNLCIRVKGSGGVLEHSQNALVTVKLEAGVIHCVAVNNSREADSISGTMRQIISNMVIGVSKGFEKKLMLVGTGYKAQAQGDRLVLTVGFSHVVNMDMPAGITVTTPTLTDVVVRGVDKQCVGQIASEIRAVRQPEPYKGKGIRYADEIISIKEVKKK